MSIENQSNTTVRKAIGWTIFLSIILIILGVLALLAPMYASAFFVAMMGWFALISGVVMVVQSFMSKPVRGFWLNLIVVLLYIISGIYILLNLAAAVAILTLTFGVLFVTEGIFGIIMGITQKAGLRLSWLVVLNGIVTLILGILVLNSWPSSALWLIGLYVGISVLFNGIALLFSVLDIRRSLPA